MPIFNEIEKEVINRATPSKDEQKKIDNLIQNLIKILEKEIKYRKLPISIQLVGSIAKGTYLKNNLDIDMFLMFPTYFSKDEIADHALSIGGNILKKTEECYAEHPYIRGLFKNYKVEIVPCYKIDHASQKLTAVDRTPLHTLFVKKKLLDSQKNEVRILKQFLIGIECYGAEAEIEGFSGYLCEILIIKYKTFRNLIKNARKWEYGINISLSNNSHPSFDTPLSFIDPVDDDRNVASALSNEKFKLFIKACNEFYRKPRITFFFPNKVKPWRLDKIKSKIEKDGFDYLGIILVKPDIILENLYPQIRKALRSIRDACERNDFKILDMLFNIDESNKLIYLIIKYKESILSETYIHTGPPLKLKKNYDDFIIKWKNNSRVVKEPFEKNNRIYVEIKREYTDIKKFLKDKLKELSLGKHIDKIVKDKYEIIELHDLLKNNFKIFWTVYLDTKMTWQR